MSDEIVIQNELLQQVQALNIPAVATETFPAHIGMQFRIMIVAANSSGIDYLLGPYLDVASTGGRIDYKDYSGEVKIDQIFKAYSIGITGEIKIPVGNNFHLSPSFSIPLIYGTMQVANETRIGENTVSQDLNFTATTIGLQPGFTVGYDISKISFGLHLSYLFSFPASYTLNSNSNIKLQNKHGDQITMGTTGFRLGLILGYNF